MDLSMFDIGGGVDKEGWITFETCIKGGLASRLQDVERLSFKW